MVNHSAVLDRTYQALGHEIRRAMLERLKAGPMRITALAEPFDVSLPAVSKHVRVLETAGLVSRTIAGRDHRLSLDSGSLQAAGAWLDTYRQFWDERLDALEAHLGARR